MRAAIELETWAICSNDNAASSVITCHTLRNACGGLMSWIEKITNVIWLIIGAYLAETFCMFIDVGDGKADLGIVTPLLLNVRFSP